MVEKEVNVSSECDWMSQGENINLRLVNAPLFALKTKPEVKNRAEEPLGAPAGAAAAPAPCRRPSVVRSSVRQAAATAAAAAPAAKTAGVLGSEAASRASSLAGLSLLGLGASRALSGREWLLPASIPGKDCSRLKVIQAVHDNLRPRQNAASLET